MDSLRVSVKNYGKYDQFHNSDIVFCKNKDEQTFSNVDLHEFISLFVSAVISSLFGSGQGVVSIDGCDVFIVGKCDNDYEIYIYGFERFYINERELVELVRGLFSSIGGRHNLIRDLKSSTGKAVIGVFLEAG